MTKSEIHKEIIKCDNRKDYLAIRIGYLELQKLEYIQEMQKINKEIANWEKILMESDTQ